MLTLHLCKFSFMPGYEVWTHHGESVCQRTASMEEEEDDRRGDDRMVVEPGPHHFPYKNKSKFQKNHKILHQHPCLFEKFYSNPLF
jgi:hypothetical protein